MLDAGTAHETRWDERDYLAVAAGTIAHIGLNFKPFHRYDERPGALPHARHPRVARGVREGASAHPPGEPMRPGKAYEAVSTRAIVRSADGVLRYMIDGDLHETRGELEVSIGPASGSSSCR